MDHFAELESPFGQDLLFRQLAAHESLSEPFTFTITALSPKPDLDFDQLLGQHVTVSMHVDPDVQADPRWFDGLVEQVALIGQSGRFFEYLLRVRPWFWFLTQTQDCKIFQDMTVLQVIDEVLKDHPIASIDNRTTTSFTPWVYCVQYRESDFNFLSRLMEQEGIGYYFTHAKGKHTLVMFDGISGHDDCPGCGALAVRYPDSPQGADQESVYDLTCTQRVQPGAAVIQDYDFTRSQADLKQVRSAPAKHALGDYEVFDYPGLYDKEGDGDHFVRAQMEEFACPAKTATGSSDARMLACGGLVTLKGSLRPTDDSEYLVAATQVIVTQPHYETAAADDEAGYRCAFSALETSVPYRAARKTPKPAVKGPQTAVVVGPSGDEIYTDKYSRVKVQFHWDRYGGKNEKSSCWVRVSTPWAGKSFGFVQIPRIGHEVVVDFLEGDPDQPIITGRVYNGDNMPPWDLPANATQSGVLTRSSKGGAVANANALRFEDKKGSEQLWLHAEKDQLVEVEHDEAHWVGHDRTKNIDHDETTHVKHDRMETVDNDETIHIKHDRTETVDNDETILVKRDRKEKVVHDEVIIIGNDHTETIMGSMSATVNKTKSETVILNSAETVGIAKELTVGGLYQVTVGAAHNTSVGAAHALEVVGSSAEVIGGSKTLSVTGGHTVSVNGKQSTSVSKDHSLDVQGKSDETIKGEYTFKAKSIAITAEEELTITVGSAKIVLNKNGTILFDAKDVETKASGDIKKKASGDIVLKGTNIKHN